MGFYHGWGKAADQLEALAKTLRCKRTDIRAAIDGLACVLREGPKSENIHASSYGESPASYGRKLVTA
jgi:hypothetical protein